MRKFEIRYDFIDGSYAIGVVHATCAEEARVLAARDVKTDVETITVLCSIDLEPQVPLVRFS